MKFLERLWQWFIGFNQRPVGESAPPKAPEAPITYRGIEALDKTPADEMIEGGKFYVIAFNDQRYWAMFRCPCGCGEVVSLPLRNTHSPHWSVTVSHFDRPSLYPSVWRNRGCMSHFVIRDGRVLWTRDTGLAPSRARPDLYAPPRNTH